MMMMMMLLTLTLIYWNFVSLIMALSLTLMLTILKFKYDMMFCVLTPYMSMDSISFPLITLSIWISILMILASHQILNNKNFNNYFLIFISLLLIILSLTFLVKNSIQFYILFEASLIPTFILILGWGYQPERLQAGVYMLMYTILASLPLLTLLLYWANFSFSFNLSHLTPLVTNSFLLNLWFLSAFMAFSVKLPMYLVHLWLPKAHVEAPVAGSMILASILLKLGGYGMLRLSPKLTLLLSKISWIWIVWAMMGGMVIGFICLFQMDIKFIVALSSVAHMAMVAGGIFSLYSYGLNGAMIIMMGHGFCSSGLFCIANMSYERVKTRSLKIMKGLSTTMPVMAMWWFLLSVFNMAAPPSLNLMGEMFSIIALLSWSKFMMLPAAFLVFLAAAYSLYMYSVTQHGKLSSSSLNSKPTLTLESLILILHLIPLNFLILYPMSIQIYY